MRKVENILPSNVEIVYVRQPQQLGLGHAVQCAQTVVDREPFAVLLADDFLTNYEPGVTSDLIKEFERTGKSQLSVIRVNSPEISKYGVIIKSETEGNISGIVEKPAYGDAPSNLASIGRYVLTPDIFDVLGSLANGSGNEIQLVDAINFQAQRDVVNTVFLKGTRFDCGSVDGYLDAIMRVSGRS